jgi:hypothetical protein
VGGLVGCSVGGWVGWWVGGLSRPKNFERMSSLRLRSLALLALLALLASCGDTSAPKAVVAATGIKVSPQSVQLANVGETRQLTATIAPLDASDRTVIWESSDSTIASVNAGGLVTAKRAGLGVFVTALTSDRKFQASVNVSVGQ